MQIELNDAADELLIVPQKTIDVLFKLPNGADCLSLYMFYYKTAKWQKTNKIKATDSYAQKSLGWGKTKLLKAKEELKQKGLISIVQRRAEGKIEGWYVEVKYVVSKTTTQRITEEVNIKKSQNQQVVKSTSSFQNTNAYIEHIKCLENTIEMLNNKLAKYEKNLPKKEEFGDPNINEMFDEWEIVFGFPQKQSKDNRYACNNLLKRAGIGKDNLKKLIRARAEADKDRYAPKEVRSIVDFKSLQSNLPHLIMWARRKYSEQQEQKGVIEI